MRNALAHQIRYTLWGPIPAFEHEIAIARVSIMFKRPPSLDTIRICELAILSRWKKQLTKGVSFHDCLVDFYSQIVAIELLTSGKTKSNFKYQHPSHEELAS